jgi:putative SOS response-associated peptidase YedK
LWENWREPESGETILSATIIAGAANKWTARNRNRAPVMLERKNFDSGIRTIRHLPAAKTIYRRFCGRRVGKFRSATVQRLNGNLNRLAK